MAALAVVVVAPAATAAPAEATSEQQYAVAFTGGAGVYARSAPAYDARTATAVPEGTVVTSVCWTEGGPVTSVTGYRSTIRVVDAQGRFWSEAWLETGGEGPPDGLSQCGPPPDDAIVTHLGYDADRAVDWALAHVQDVQPLGASGCADFVSQALWAGGLPQSEEWNDHETPGPRPWLTGTPTMWLADALVGQLAGTDGVRLVPLDLSFGSVPQAVPGDVIAYDYEGDGVYDHVALVTSLAAGDYPVVSEWGTSATQLIETYPDRGWTWSENSGEWLQQVYPGITATLVRLG